MTEKVPLLILTDINDAYLNYKEYRLILVCIAYIG